jgi:hypothetical protein
MPLKLLIAWGNLKLYRRCASALVLNHNLIGTGLSSFPQCYVCVQSPICYGLSLNPELTLCAFGKNYLGIVIDIAPLTVRLIGRSLCDWAWAALYALIQRPLLRT